MKFVAYLNGENAAADARYLFEQRGIPVVVESERLTVPFGPYGARYRFRLFVCLDSQYEDAVRLLADETHVVENAVDADRYHRWVSVQPLSRDIVRGATYVLLMAAAFFLVVWYLVTV